MCYSLPPCSKLFVLVTAQDFMTARTINSIFLLHHQSLFEQALRYFILVMDFAADHRNIVRSPVLLRELWLETVHSFHPDAKRHFVSKGE